MSVSSFSRVELLDYNWIDFRELNIFTKIRGHVLIFVQIGKNNRHFNEKLPRSMRLAFIAEKETFVSVKYGLRLKKELTI